MIADDIAPALLELQAHAESMMLDTCTVQRPTGTVTDPMTGRDETTYTPVYPAAGGVGKCRVKPPAYESATAESATSQVTEQRATHEVPASAPALLPGDLVTYADDTHTPRLRKMRARVDGVHVGTHTTAQRVPVTILPGVVE